MKTYNIIIIVLSVLSIILLYFIMITLDNNRQETTISYDLYCLEDYADDYCVTYPYDVNPDGFHCMVEYLPRENMIEITKKYLFLESELNACTIQQLNSQEVK